VSNPENRDLKDFQHGSRKIYQVFSLQTQCVQDHCANILIMRHWPYDVKSHQMWLAFLKSTHQFCICLHRMCEFIGTANKL